MNAQHTELASGRWNSMSLSEQMGNIGSEVERTIKWKEKKNESRWQNSFKRTLELLELSLNDPSNRHRLKEIARTKELFIDFAFGDNQFSSTASSIKKYFLQFAIAARNKN